MSARTRRAAVLLALGCAAGTEVSAARRGLPLIEAGAFLTVGLLFVLAGGWASARRRDSASGRLLTLTGFAWLLSVALTTSGNPALFTAGLALLAFGLAPLGHLAVVFPGGQALSRDERLVAVTPYALAMAALPVIGSASCQNSCRTEPIGLEITRGLGRIWYVTLLVAVLLTAALVTVVLVRRWRRAGPAGRRVLLPVVPGACVFTVVYAAGLLAELGVPTGLGSRWALVALVLLAVAPVVFLAGLLRSHLARAGVGGLVVELGEAAAGDGLREGLARALGDPSLALAYWCPGTSSYADADGAPLQLPAGEAGRTVTLIERSGRRVGALVHDAALTDDPFLVDTVAAAAGLAMENERLHVEVLARLEEVRASRARIVAAADAARREVERDLHDGAQQRLVALALAVGMARDRLTAAPDSALDALLAKAAQEARLALKELRELGQGLHPAVLTDSGLGPALESLAERSSVPVEVTVHTHGRLPAPVEIASYYAVSEALANVAKHAGASAVTVRVRHLGERLRVEVADDGVGGAQVRPGSGLEGLVDRVAALDGRMELDSPPGHGTRLCVELPCSCMRAGAAGRAPARSAVLYLSGRGVLTEARLLMPLRI